jgi:hypothetical protein
MRKSLLLVMMIGSLLVFPPMTSMELRADATPAATASQERIKKKLRTIIIDKLNFDRIDLRNILSYLTNRSKELDPEHEGVKFVLQGPYQPPPPPAPDQPLHREGGPTLENVPLADVVNYFCETTDHDYKIEDDAVVLFPVKKH